MKYTYPKISFGIIVLNGEPFTRYCLRSLYPFAHEIIVAEGATELSSSVATPDGHSIDGTLEALRRFKEEEDPENKIQIITNNGFWPALDEEGRFRTVQSRAYAERATGDYLWQVDIDEFYRADEMHTMLDLLSKDTTISGAAFSEIQFWGAPNIEVSGWKHMVKRNRGVPRLFKWGPGYRYLKHRPSTVLNDNGVNLQSLNWLSGRTTRSNGIFFYHYSSINS